MIPTKKQREPCYQTTEIRCLQPQSQWIWAYKSFCSGISAKLRGLIEFGRTSYFYISPFLVFEVSPEQSRFSGDSNGETLFLALFWRVWRCYKNVYCNHIVYLATLKFFGGVFILSVEIHCKSCARKSPLQPFLDSSRNAILRVKTVATKRLAMETTINTRRLFVGSVLA